MRHGKSRGEAKKAKTGGECMHFVIDSLLGSKLILVSVRSDHKMSVSYYNMKPMIVSEALKYESQVSGVRSQDLHSFRLLCRCASSLDFRLIDKFNFFSGAHLCMQTHLRHSVHVYRDSYNLFTKLLTLKFR